MKRITTALARLSPLGVLRALSPASLFCPTYHVVAEAQLPHIKHLYRHRTTREFEADLSYMLRHFTPVGLDALVDHFLHGKKLPPKAMHLSFDDGLSPCHEVIAPMLAARGVPATFFLNSAFVDNKGLMFRYKQSLLIERYIAPSQEQELKSLFRKWDLPYRDFGNSVKSIPYAKRQALDELADLVGLSFALFLEKERPYLSSEQVKSLLGQCFTIGAHSINHPLYHDLPLEEQLRQTQESVSQLQQQFDLPYRVFAFPFTDYGVKKEFFERARPFLDLSFGIAGLKGDISPLHIQRFPMEASTLPPSANIKTEYLESILKFMLGKYRIRR